MTIAACPNCTPDTSEAEAMTRHGIKRVLSAVYLVGDYRYTCLADALFEARRAEGIAAYRAN